MDYGFRALKVLVLGPPFLLQPRLATVGWIATDLGFRFPGEKFQALSQGLGFRVFLKGFYFEGVLYGFITRVLQSFYDLGALVFIHKVH